MAATAAVATYRLGRLAGNSGLAVSADGNVMLVANSLTGQVDVYNARSGMLMASVGDGTGPRCRFSRLEKVCFTATGTVLAVVAGHGWVEEFTLDGEHVRFFLTGACIGSVAASLEHVAVGKIGGAGSNRGERVTLFRADNGFFECAWGTWGQAPGQVGDCRGMRFHGDGASLFIAENSRVSHFQTDGTLLRVFHSVGLDSPQDVEVLESGMVIAADWAHNRLSAWPAGDGRATWVCERELFRPTALAVHNNVLFVLNSSNGRVNLFSITNIGYTIDS